MWSSCIPLLCKCGFHGIAKEECQLKLDENLKMKCCIFNDHGGSLCFLTNTFFNEHNITQKEFKARISYIFFHIWFGRAHTLFSKLLHRLSRFI